MAKNVIDSYKMYKKTTENPVDLSTYRKITGEYQKFLIEKVVQEGKEVTLPARLGTLLIQGERDNPKIDDEGNVTGLAISWGRTFKLWNSNPEAKAQKKLVYCTNEHTGGIRYSYLWRKKNVIILNKVLYSLILTRTNKRTASALMFKGKEYLLKQ